MNGDDDAKLRDAFARMRADEAQRAPTLAQLLARAERRAARRGPRWAYPLVGAALAGFVWWVSAAGPARDAESATARAPERPATARKAPLAPPIALGSLRSPTDVLLAPPLPSFPRGFSGSAIPAPRDLKPLRDGGQSRISPAWRFPA
jgi:hypothetical protein